MEIDLVSLPEDAQALKALVQQLVGTVRTQGLKIAQLETRLAKLKRMQFGQSSEKLAREIEQLELELDALLVCPRSLDLRSEALVAPPNRQRQRR